MSAGWLWPDISDKTSARKAITGGFWACMLIAFFDLAVAVWSIATRQHVAGYYDQWILVDAFLFGIVAWRMWKNSRTWAVIGLVLQALEMVDKLQHAASTFGIITVLLLLAIMNAVRGTFAFHRYAITDVSFGTGPHDLSAPLNTNAPSK